MNRTLAALVTLAALACSSVAAAEPAVDPAVELGAGKAAFEKNCRLCHTLERSLAKHDDVDGWTQTVKRMVLYGAPLKSPERVQVARYLAAQSLFASSCKACHSPTKAVGDAPGARDWKAIGERMAAHLAELERQGKAPGGTVLDGATLAEIGAFLRVVVAD